MKKRYFLAIILLGLFACKKEKIAISVPSDVGNISVSPRVGAALIRWTVPEDSNYLYMQIRYKKGDKSLIVNASKYADSMLVDGLINKLDYIFELQTFNNNGSAITAGASQMTGTVRPIRRPIEETSIKNTITTAMLECYPAQIDEGNGSGTLAKLIDDDRNTFFHSDYNNSYPLPYWIKVSFTEPTAVSEIRYYFRNNSTLSGRPTEIQVQASDDGNNWTDIFTATNLNVNVSNSIEQKFVFDKSYTSKYLRILFTKIYNDAGYITLGEMSFFNKTFIDREVEAEEDYYY